MLHYECQLKSICLTENSKHGKPDSLQNHYQRTPICLIHGLEDDVLPAAEMVATAKFLQNHNIPFQQLLIKNLGHSIDSEALEFALKFINESFKMPI